MELKGSQTEKNLWTAFAGESQAHTKYAYYASQAKKDGYVQIQNIFNETSVTFKFKIFLTKHQKTNLNTQSSGLKRFTVVQFPQRLTI